MSVKPTFTLFMEDLPYKIAITPNTTGLIANETFLSGSKTLESGRPRNMKAPVKRNKLPVRNQRLEGIAIPYARIEILASILMPPLLADR